MPRNHPLNDPKGFLRKYWSPVVQATVWITSVIGVFLNRPPGLSLDDNRKIVPFANFVVAAILALTMILLTKWGKREHAKFWWLAGFALLLLSIMGFFIYDLYLSEWTAPFTGSRVVRGVTLTEVGEKATSDEGYVSDEDLLMQFGGQSALLWQLHELETRRRALAIIYVTCTAVTTLTIVTIVQAIHCSTKKRASR